MTICRHCEREKHMICICGFCSDCVEANGHEYLSQIYHNINEQKRLKKNDNKKNH